MKGACRSNLQLYWTLSTINSIDESQLMASWEVNIVILNNFYINFFGIYYLVFKILIMNFSHLYYLKLISYLNNFFYLSLMACMWDDLVDIHLSIMLDGFIFTSILLAILSICQ